MSAIINTLPEEWRPTSGEFIPVARYVPAMDFVLYQNEDCDYRADRVDTFLTILRHPTDDDRLVGLKLKGFRFLFRQVNAILKAARGVQLEEEHFLPLVAVLEAALVAGMGEAILGQVERERLEKRYEAARRFAAEHDAKIDRNIMLAAA